MAEKNGDVFHIYGRKEFPEPLEFVRAAGAAEMGALAETKEEWVELIAFPASAAIRVIPWEEENE